VIAEYDETGTVTAQFVHGSGLGADVGSMICSESIDNGAVDVEWFCYNWRGDVIAVTDGGGAALSSYRYDAFGQVIGSGMPERGFSSKEYNERTSLSYFGARYYDASIGRFISRDPMGFIDGPNEYIYCANNPVFWLDPFGLCRGKNSYATYGSYSSIAMMNSTFGVPLGATSSNLMQDARDVTDALGQVAFDKMYGKTTGMGITLQVLASTTGLDALGDVSNVIYDIKTGQNWKQTGWDFAMALPVLGSLKIIDRVTDAAKAGKKIINAGDSIADATRSGGRVSEGVSNVTDPGNIKQYKQLTRELKQAGLSSEYEAHKLIEKRHGIGNYRETPSVPLKKGAGGHQDITNVLRKDLPYGRRYSSDAVSQSIEKTYQRRDWITAAKEWIKNNF